MEANFTANLIDLNTVEQYTCHQDVNTIKFKKLFRFTMKTRNGSERKVLSLEYDLISSKGKLLLKFPSAQILSLSLSVCVSIT